MTIAEIKNMPSVYSMIHESVFRSYQLLEKVKEMLSRGDSVETILEIIKEVEDDPERINISFGEVPTIINQ